MKPRRRIVFWICVAGVLSIGVGPPPARAGGPAPDSLARLCDYGITLALSGQDAGAESVFVALLSRVPRDARALNNLGNLRLWRGDTNVALAFYARAEEADSTDAGILLNEATALMIAGESEAAHERADEAVQAIGGPEPAARLLGLRYAEMDEDAPRASDRAQLSRDEVLALLRAAARAVPVDSTRANAGTSGGPGAKKRKPIPAWRSAGARGSSDTDVTAVVYWKH